MLDFPEIKNGSDVLNYFAEFYERATGQQLPPKEWGKGAGFIKTMKKKGYNIKEIATIVWGITNTKPQTRSIWYCASFFDQLGKFYDLKEEYERKKKLDEEVEEVEYIEVEDKQEDDEEDLFDEFL